jgi:hypothetical protein
MGKEPAATPPASDYQSAYYRRTKPERQARNQFRWRGDPEYRRRESDRTRSKRALARAECVAARINEAVDAKRCDVEDTRVARDVFVDGRDQKCYSTGSLAREIGRDSVTVRSWLTAGVLPGASHWTNDGRAWFTADFSGVVRAAMRRLYLLDGRGPLGLLRQFVREELERAGLHVEPKPARRRSR